MAIENRAAPQPLAAFAPSEREVADDVLVRPLGRPSGAGGRKAALEQLLDMVERAPEQFDFFQLLRRLQSLVPEGPRIGEALDPSEEQIRLGQEPSLGFAPAPLAGLARGVAGGPPRLLVHFFGLLGPNGPLPLHLTEYARDRQRNSEDPTMSRFLDIFHHRMLLLMFRAWAHAQPTVSHDRPRDDHFATYVAALEGLGMSALRDRDAFPDAAKLFYVGRLAAQTGNAEGLAAVIGDFFGMPTRVQSFVPDWLDLPTEHRWHLGTGRLGLSSTVGARVASRQHKFRVLLGPLDRGQFQRMLPGGRALPKLTAIVRGYVGDQMRWDVRLVLSAQLDEPWRLGRAQLAWTTWLGRPRAGYSTREDLILDPQAESQRVAA